MNKCKTCVFWGKKTKPGYRVCTNYKMISQISEDGIWIGKKGLQIQTSKDFGCIHWE